MLNYAVLPQQQYVDFLINLISSAEGHRQVASFPPNDPNATVGYGYTFNRNNNLSLWQSAGIVLTPAEKTVLQNIDAAPASQRGTMAVTQFTRSITKDEAKSLLSQTYGQYEGPALGMPPSLERAALVSLTYNRGVTTVNAAMTGFFTAIQNQDRAEAWFQMRYNAWGTASASEAGLRARRLVEAQVFGLYDDVSNVPADEAKQIFRMLAVHKQRIFEDEARWGVNPDGSAGIRNLIAEVNNDSRWATLPRVRTLAEVLNPALDPILTKYIENPNYGNKSDFSVFGVQVATEITDIASFGLGETALTGTNVDDANNPTGNDLLLGAKNSNNVIDGKSGNDIIYGGDRADELTGGLGADVLIGGKGYDILNGGIGSDTYIIKAGEGTDTIIDGDGLGTIKFTKADGITVIEIKGGKSINGNDTSGNPLVGLWESDDKNVRYALISGDAGQKDLVITFPNEPASTGNIIIKNFIPTANQLGIELSAGVAPPARNTISGTADDDNGTRDSNNVTHAALAATGINQEVVGLGGSDRITVAFNGDIARGGDGNDYLINGSGDQELYGDAGNDILTATDGDDKLFGGLGDDILQGGADNDTLDGGAGNDLLDGGLGADILIGGDGSDFIIGGGSFEGFYNPVTAVNGTATLLDIVNDNIVGFTARGANGLAATSADLQLATDAGNIIDAGAGNDFVVGGTGSDVIDAGADDDIVIGLAGDDVIRGGSGNDDLYGDGTDADLNDANSSTGAAYRQKVADETHQRLIYVESCPLTTKCGVDQALVANDACWRKAA